MEKKWVLAFLDFNERLSWRHAVRQQGGTRRNLEQLPGDCAVLSLSTVQRKRNVLSSDTRGSFTTEAWCRGMVRGLGFGCDRLLLRHVKARVADTPLSLTRPSLLT